MTGIYERCKENVLINNLCPTNLHRDTQMVLRGACVKICFL